MLLMKYPVCSISFKVYKRLHACHTFLLVLKHWSIVIFDSYFWALECAPDLSDPMSAATYAAEEISEAKDGFVRYFSDEEGMTTHSYSTRNRGLFFSILYMWCNHDSYNLPTKPQGTSTSAMLTLWSLVDELSIQLMTLCVKLWAPSRTHCVL